MAVQRVVCGHCDETKWLTRCDGCEQVIGREDPQLQLNNLYGNNLDISDEARRMMQGRQLTLCGGCLIRGVDLLRVLMAPAKSYPELAR